MNPEELLSLADRCEQAGGPDRELDLAISKACGLRPSHLAFIPGGADLAWDPEDGGCGFRIEPYTASLDAAMGLTGEDTVAILLEALAAASRFFVRFNDGGDHIKNALPRFVTAACLRAIASSTGRRG